MRTRCLGVLAACAAVAAFAARAAAQTPEIQDALEVLLAESKPAAKGSDKGEAKPRPAPPIDYLDFAFAASDRPVLLRLHLRNGARPYSAAWDDYMKKFFNYFDKNGDGELVKAEVERAPNSQFLQFHLQGNIGFPLQGQTIRMPQIDSDKDGKVSLVEFKAYYQRGGIGPLQFFNNSNQASTDVVTDTILKHLDVNKDGKLSAEELAKATAALRRLDLDEDETISTAELTPGGGDNNGFFFAPPASGPMAGPSIGFVEIKPGAIDGAARQMLAHYDKNKNGKLSREEIGLDESLFDRLDANRDDRLDAKEFAGFFRRDADLELIGRIGKPEAKEVKIANFLRKIGLGSQPIRAEVFNPRKRSMPLTAAVHRHDASALAFDLGDAKIGLSVSDQTFGQFSNLKRFYTQQFKMADTKKKGVVDRKQAMATDFLDQIFPLADRDGDGKLTEKELNVYLDMQVEGSSCQLQLSITDEGRSMFDALDENGDGRLSVREMRTSWSRIKSLAKSANGLARLDIPRRLDVSVGPAQRRFRPALVRARAAKAKPAPQAAPIWFTKMDRNGDGDVSQREFIGREEDFKALDADGDGLISAEEARQFEARLKKEKAKR